MSHDTPTVPPPPATRPDRTIGIGLVLLSATAWSLNGLYTRFLTTDLPTTIVGRALAIALFLGAALLIRHGRGAGALVAYNMRRAVWVVLSGALCMLTFVAALFYTSVANVTVIYAISPLIAAVIARFLIGDRLVARTLVAFAASLAGIVIMVGASIGTERLFGDMLALVMSATFAVVIVEMRRKPDIDNVASSFLTSALLALVLLPFASFATIGAGDAVLLFLFGFTSNVLGFFLFVAGVRRMPPAEAGLIATVEIALAPFWVWLFFGEEPGRATVLGGGIVVAAVMVQILGDIRRGRTAKVVIAEGVGAGLGPGLKNPEVSARSAPSRPASAGG